MEASTGLNAIFFRARTVRDWHRLAPSERGTAEEFSIRRAETIVRALRPREIVVVGLGTLNRITKGDGEIAVQTDRRMLARCGELWGSPAIGIVHLSGARVSREDWDRLAAYVRGI